MPTDHPDPFIAPHGAGMPEIRSRRRPNPSRPASNTVEAGADTVAAHDV